MAAGIILQFPPSVGEAEYDAVNEQLGWDTRTGEGEWPDGLLAHSAGPSDAGWVVTELWESQAAQGAFMDTQLGPAFGVVNLPDPTSVTWYEVVASQHRH